MVKIHVKNGFGYAEEVYSINAELKVTSLYYTGECTWHDDPAENGERELSVPDGAVALVRAGHRDGHGTYRFDLVWGEIPTSFSLPTDKILWFKSYGQHTLKSVQILNASDYVQAQIEDTIREFDSTEWQSMPYHAGDQAAACFWRFNGELDVWKGCGDMTPYFNKDGVLTSDFVEQEKEFRRIGESIKRGDTFQNGEVLQHLKSSFRFKNNPLPTMRKQFGGTWKYFDSTREVRMEWDNIRFSGESPIEAENIMIFIIPDCFVIWVKE